MPALLAAAVVGDRNDGCHNHGRAVVVSLPSRGERSQPVTSTFEAFPMEPSHEVREIVNDRAARQSKPQ